MSDPYTDADVQTVADALDEWLFRMHGLTSSCRHEDESRAILARVAPAIAARALREEADRTYTHTTISQDNRRIKSERPVWSLGERQALRTRADEIERTH